MTDLLTQIEPATKVTSSMIKAAIRASYAAPAYQTFFEVSNDTGSRIKTYADAVSIGIWPSTGHQVHGFEVKVSRTDFLNEMKNPGKSMPIFKHCHRWSLVCPQGMVKSDELPPNWGLLTFKDGSLRNAKSPPLLQPEAMTPGFVAALVRRAGELDNEIVASAVQKARLEERAAFARSKEQEIHRLAGNHNERAAAALKFLESFEKAMGSKVYSFGVEEYAPIIALLHKSGLDRSWNGPSQIAKQLEASAKQIRDAVKEFGAGVVK
ncbi:hypothetical protein [Phyllobacterium ifriqiyense]|uniref:hypothetical protein n=1 Tax=Phyllobacterium ifriqiyense TaxID=314238 RepID=UPI003397C29E